VIDCVATWSAETELPATCLLGWLGLSPSKYFDWKRRYGQANEQNAKVPRDPWLEAKVMTALNDSRDATPHDQALEHAHWRDVALAGPVAK
jgi:hypothetical protein